MQQKVVGSGTESFGCGLCLLIFRPINVNEDRYEIQVLGLQHLKRGNAPVARKKIKQTSWL